MCKKLVFLILSFILFTATQIFSASIQNVEILKENTQQYELDEILHNKNLPFSDYQPGETNLIKTSYWLRFTYTKPSIQNTYLLYSPFILHQKLDLYFAINDSLYHFENGISLDFEGRNLYSPGLYLTLPNVNHPVVCYLHIVSFYNYSYFFAEVDSINAFNAEVKQSNIEFMFIGFGLLTFIFSIIFFLYLRERLYLYYGLFSLMLIMSRLTINGYLINFIHGFYTIDTLKSAYNLYSITYAGVNIALLLYFHEYFRFHQRSKRYSLTIYGFVIIRLLFLIVHISTESAVITTITRFVDNHFIDLAIQFFLLAVAFQTAKKHFKPSVIAIISLVLLIIGNLLYILPDWGIIKLGTGINSYFLFLNFAAVEVIVFTISMAYRSHYLKQEHDKAVGLVIENMKANEQLKDNINKELEIKVAERTAEIQQMNELLKLHNIELKSEVNDSLQARVFQKNMSFEEFKKIFPTEDACFLHLSNLKRQQNPIKKCKKCGYDKFTELENYALRCGKCCYTESTTTGTLFTKLKFSIIKAFYITYLTSTTTKESATLAQIATEIDLRPATLWAFKQKVLVLMESNKNKKKHKDGWTHLIEYSIKNKIS